MMKTTLFVLGNHQRFWVKLWRHGRCFQGECPVSVSSQKTDLMT